MEKFSNTYLEMNLKLLFYSINDQLSSQDFMRDLLIVLSNQYNGSKFLAVPQISQAQEQAIMKATHLAAEPSLSKKNEAITIISQVMSKIDCMETQFHIFIAILTSSIIRDLVDLPTDTAEPVKISYFNLILDLLERFIFQTEYVINIETAQMQGTKNYALINERHYLQNHPQIYFSAGVILNKVLIIPQDIQLQIRAFIMIRRLFYLFPDLRGLLEGPINVVLTNISLYSTEVSQEKEATIFLFKVLSDKTVSESFKEKLNANEHLKILYSNRYYSAKSNGYINDIDKIYKYK